MEKHFEPGLSITQPLGTPAFTAGHKAVNCFAAAAISITQCCTLPAIPTFSYVSLCLCKIFLFSGSPCKIMAIPNLEIRVHPCNLGNLRIKYARNPLWTGYSYERKSLKFRISIARTGRDCFVCHVHSVHLLNSLAHPLIKLCN